MSSVLILCCFALSLGVCWLVKRAGVLDHPNHRSSHSRPTPRGGGLGILAAIGLGLMLAMWMGQEVRPLALAALGFGLLGMGDDLLALGTRLKFVIIIALSSLLVWLTGPVAAIGITPDMALALPWLAGFAGAVLWIFVAANATNFMDGSDGLIVAIFIPVGLGLGVIGVGVTSITGFALAAGLVGFSIFNVPKAYLFLGDVGSLAIGAIVAVAGLQLIEAPTDIWLFPLLILPVLADVLLTLVGKVRNRIGFLSPHRTHAYQLLVRMDWPHWHVALAYFAISMLCVGLAIGAKALGGPAPFAAFSAMVLVLTALHTLIRRKAAKAGMDLKS
ncbi:glycosyltransferase family 4 protein [Hyphobacterium sp.]|uniref:glycosyltransferase family 4 protein n=1 Tax=Hyphobacterium sp. TaxID=2004662 RepID=UPI00374875C0